MVERRPVYGVESSPPVTPPRFVELAEITDGDTPRGVTVGPTFPSTPAPYHRHFLTDDVINSTEEWFYWDPLKQGTGAWLSERFDVWRFGSSSAVTNAALQAVQSGASSAANGYTAHGRPRLLFASYGMQTGGSDNSLKLNLHTSAAPTEVASCNLLNNARFFQSKRDILIPANPLGGEEIFWCNALGATGTNVSVMFHLRRLETNP